MLAEQIGGDARAVAAEDTKITAAAPRPQA
jgi:hypothetical protein